MDGNFRKKIALKLKEPSSSTTLTSTVAVEQTADLSTVTSSNSKSVTVLGIIFYCKIITIMII